MNLELLNEWLMGLSENYNVNPYIFAGIYVGAIPFFTLSVAWLIRHKRQNRTITLPVLSTGLFFSSSYLYILVSGENVPVWVYALIISLLRFGAYSTFKKISTKQEKKVVE